MQYKQKGRTDCLMCQTQCKMQCRALFPKYIKNFKIAMAELQTKHRDNVGVRPGVLHRLRIHRAGLEGREEVQAVLYVPVQ